MRKKISLLLSLLVLAALLLTACGTSDTDNDAANPGAAGTAAVGTPGAEGNGTPASNGAAGSGQVTPAAGIPTQTAAAGASDNQAGTALAVTPTAAGGAGVVPSGTLDSGTPMAGATATAGAAGVIPSGTLDAGTPVANLTGTPAASVPVTSGANMCQFTRLSKFTGLPVVNAQNQVIGQVDDVVVVRDTSVFQTSMNNTGSNASTTGQANGNGTANNPNNNASPNGQANGTGNNKNNAQGGVVMSAGQALAPMINYVVVDLAADFGDKTVLVPFSSFKFDKAQAANSAVQAAGSAAAQAGAQVTTPVAGAVEGTPVATAAAAGGSANNTANAANAADSCVASLNVQPASLANLPAFDAAAVDFAAANWDQQYRSFWASQGGVIPATGSDKYGAPLLLADNVDDIDVRNANNEQLGEVEDFIIDPTSGRLSYAAMATGGFLGIGEKFILIPISAMNWVSTGQNNAVDSGYLLLNLTKEQVQAAPTVDNLDNVNFFADKWDESLMNYWQNFGVSTSPSQQVATPGAPPSK